MFELFTFNWVTTISHGFYFPSCLNSATRHCWAPSPLWHLYFHGTHSSIPCPPLQGHLLSLQGWVVFLPATPIATYLQQSRILSLALPALTFPGSPFTSVLTGHFWSFPGRHSLPQSPPCNLQTPTACVPLPVRDLLYAQSHPHHWEIHSSGSLRVKTFHSFVTFCSPLSYTAHQSLSPTDLSKISYLCMFALSHWIQALITSNLSYHHNNTNSNSGMWVILCQALLWLLHIN